MINNNHNKIVIFTACLFMSIDLSYCIAGDTGNCFERHYNKTAPSKQKTDRITLFFLNSEEDNIVIELYFSIKTRPELWTSSGACKLQVENQFKCILDGDAGKIDLMITESFALINTNNYISGEFWRKDNESFEFYHLTGKDDTLFKLFRVPVKNCNTANANLE